MDRLEFKIKASYLLYSAKKYARKPLFSDNGKTLTIYAHELDGCPIKNYFIRTSSLPQIRNHNFDRGDSFEVGFGVTHGLPAGITICVDVTDTVRDLLPSSDIRVRLCGTPDFIVIDNGDLVIMDAKSPKRSLNDDEPKGYRVTRMSTYTRLLKKSRKNGYITTEDGITFPAKDIALICAQRTMWPVFSHRLGERKTGNIRSVIVIDDDATRSYKLIDITSYVNDNIASVEERLRMYVRTIYTVIRDPSPFSNIDIKEYVDMLHADEKRSRECAYCPLMRCQRSNVDTFELSRIRWTEKTSKDGHKYRIGRAEHVYKLDKRSLQYEVVPHDDYVFMTSDPALIRFTNENGTTVIVKAKALNNDSKGIVYRYRIHTRLPASVSE